MRHRLQRIALLFAGSFLVVVLWSALAIYRLPGTQRVAVGDRLSVDLPLPAHLRAGVTARVRESGWELLQASGGPAELRCTRQETWPLARRQGKLNLRLCLWGIPVKNVAVDVVTPLRVVPGGHSIGVLVHTDGITVVGFAAVPNMAGQEAYPAREAGIQVGDVLLKVNGEAVRDERQAAELIARYGENGSPVELTLRRGSRQLQVTVPPVLSAEDGRYHLGIYVRDGAAGVGTLTFYEPAGGAFGALGHLIEDQEKGGALAIRGGQIVSAVIQGIQKGERGRPGEKIGLFLDRQFLQGTIQKNTPYGIFGHLNEVPEGGLYKAPVPVALAGQVREGPAEILTVLEGQRIERFRVDIEKVQPQRTPQGKGLVIRITDPRLLQVTGGIVQGMSGSPIMQDGRLVGAVTHVFVNDPTRGYGVLAEWMLMEAEIKEISGGKTPPVSLFGEKHVLVVPRVTSHQIFFSLAGFYYQASNW